MSLCKSAPSVGPQSVSDAFAAFVRVHETASLQDGAGRPDEHTRSSHTHTFGLLLCQASP